MRYLILNHPYTPQPKCKSLPIQRLYFPVSSPPILSPRVKIKKRRTPEGWENKRQKEKYFHASIRSQGGLVHLCLFFFLPLSPLYKVKPPSFVTTSYMTTPELLAIRWRRNVRICGFSKRKGSTYGPQLSSLLADGASDGRALHLTLGVDDLQS